MIEVASERAKTIKEKMPLNMYLHAQVSEL